MLEGAERRTNSGARLRRLADGTEPWCLCLYEHDLSVNDVISSNHVHRHDLSLSPGEAWSSTTRTFRTRALGTLVAESFGSVDAGLFFFACCAVTWIARGMDSF